MSMKIDFDDNVLAAIHNAGSWNYCIAPVDIWVMDWEAWGASYAQAGYPDPPSDGRSRGGVLILDETSVGLALASSDVVVVPEESLRQLLRSRVQVTDWEEVMHLFPAVLIDFESRKLLSVYSEPLRLENYVPKGWVGVFGEFYEEIPMEHRYWIDGKVDYLRQALGR